MPLQLGAFKSVISSYSTGTVYSYVMFVNQAICQWESEARYGK